MYIDHDLTTFNYVRDINQFTSTLYNKTIYSYNKIINIALLYNALLINTYATDFKLYTYLTQKHRVKIRARRQYTNE